MLLSDRVFEASALEEDDESIAYDVSGLPQSSSLLYSESPQLARLMNRVIPMARVLCMGSPEVVAAPSCLVGVSFVFAL